jgi:RecJ-like exonuclease
MQHKFPGPVSCPHCGNAGAERLPIRGDFCDYRCPTCRDYSITGTQEEFFDEHTDDPTKAGFTTDSAGRRWLGYDVCPACGGRGKVTTGDNTPAVVMPVGEDKPCTQCRGAGRVPAGTSI